MSFFRLINQRISTPPRAVLAFCWVVFAAFSCLGAALADATVESADIIVVEGDILQWRDNGRRSLTLLGSSPTWRDGIVPYRIDPELPAYSISAINAAIEIWNRVSGISLVHLDEVLASDASLSAVHIDSILFQPGEGCASWVGRRGGEQEIWVAPSCTTGSMLHEIGHVLGLEHEHTRPDRDQYITVHWDNIAPEKRHNFDIASSRARAYGEYDYGSVMHYGPYNFSLGTTATITPVFATEVSLGQRSNPSEGDLAAVADLYATDLSVITQLYESSTGSEASIVVSNNLDQGAHDVEVDVSQDFSQLLAYSDNGWSCRARVPGVITCDLDRLAAGSRSVLTLRFQTDTDASAIRAEVRSKTPDPRIGNNIDTADVLTTLAAAQLQDDAQSVPVTGATHPAWLVLLLLWCQRKTRNRINR